MRRLAIVAAAALAVTAASASCQAVSIHPECSLVPQRATVQILGDEGGKFSPGTLCVKSGTRVTWQSVDDLDDHTVSSEAGDSQAFDSGSLSYRAEFAVVFKNSGHYPYVCRFHSWMSGLITVVDS